MTIKHYSDEFKAQIVEEVKQATAYYKKLRKKTLSSRVDELHRRNSNLFKKVDKVHEYILLNFRQLLSLELVFWK